MIMLADRIEDGTADQETLGGLDIDGAPQRLRPPGRLLRGRRVASSGSTHPVHAVFIRAPWVEDVGPEVEVLARVDDDSVAGGRPTGRR